MASNLPYLECQNAFLNVTDLSEIKYKLDMLTQPHVYLVSIMTMKATVVSTCTVCLMSMHTVYRTSLCTVRSVP